MMEIEQLALRRLDGADTDFDEQLESLLKRGTAEDSNNEMEARVEGYIARVRKEGDSALFALTSELDHFDVTEQNIKLRPEQLRQAYDAISQAERTALKYAAERIKEYHRFQLQSSWQYTQHDGSVLGQKITPIERVGLYVPGGKAAYPSSVLMNAIPAKVAGVKDLVMVSPTPYGQLNQIVLAAAYIADIDTVFRVGGAQAIGALAYGTKTIKAVDKIVGPGNAYVAAAKKQVFGQVGIDMIAGPSEVLVIADDSVDPSWVAMDLFAQAEHDEHAQAIFLTQSAATAERVETAIQELLPTMERQSIIAESLDNNGAVIVAKSRGQMLEIADQIAAEHLEIFTEDAALLAEQVKHAGAIFIGPYSAESLGDYCAGANHVLPTSGTARFSSPLGVYDFQKRSSMIRISEQGVSEIAEQAKIIANSEGLTAHARSAEYRIKK